MHLFLLIHFLFHFFNNLQNSSENDRIGFHVINFKKQFSVFPLWFFFVNVQKEEKKERDCANVTFINDVLSSITFAMLFLPKMC